jgi:hypothetical protein
MSGLRNRFRLFCVELLGKLQTGKALEVGVQNRPPQRKIGLPALPLYFDQAGFAQFLHMVRYRRRAEDGMRLKQAARHAIRRSHLLQDGEAMRVGKRTADSAKLRVG